MTAGQRPGQSKQACTDETLTVRALRPFQQVLQSMKSLQLLLPIAQVFSEHLGPLHQHTRVHVVNGTRSYKRHGSVVTQLWRDVCLEMAVS